MEAPLPCPSGEPSTSSVAMSHGLVGGVISQASLTERMGASLPADGKAMCGFPKVLDV